MNPNEHMEITKLVKLALRTNYEMMEGFRDEVTEVEISSEAAERIRTQALDLAAIAGVPLEAAQNAVMEYAICGLLEEYGYM